MAHRYYGRTQIFTDVEEINSGNVVAVIQKAMNTHRKNASEIRWLYNYYKGRQPIYSRTKEIRPEICNMVVENWANAIVSFKVGIDDITAVTACPYKYRTTVFTGSVVVEFVV